MFKAYWSTLVVSSLARTGLFGDWLPEDFWDRLFELLNRVIDLCFESNFDRFYDAMTASEKSFRGRVARNQMKKSVDEALSAVDCPYGTYFKDNYLAPLIVTRTFDSVRECQKADLKKAFESRAA